MAIYLAPFVGKGTRKNPFHVLEQFKGGGTSIGLRPDGSKQTGYAILQLPEPSRNPRLIKLADDHREQVGAAALNAIRDKLDSSQTKQRLDVIIAKLLRHPPRDRWNPIIPNHLGEYAIYLGGEKIYSEPVIKGGATDTFVRGNETPIASPWTKENSDGSNVNLTSNTAVKTASDSVFYYYSGAASTADQYAQAVEASAGSLDFGPAVRIQGGTSEEGYVLDPFAFGEVGLIMYSGGSFSNVTGTSGEFTYTPGDLLKIEVTGTAFNIYVDGVAATTGFPYSEGTVTAAGHGVGFWMYASGVAVNSWEGGDMGAVPGASQRFMWTP